MEEAFDVTALHENTVKGLSDGFSSPLHGGQVIGEEAIDFLASTPYTTAECAPKSNSTGGNSDKNSSKRLFQVSPMKHEDGQAALLLKKYQHVMNLLKQHNLKLQKKTKGQESSVVKCARKSILRNAGGISSRRRKQSLQIAALLEEATVVARSPTAAVGKVSKSSLVGPAKRLVVATTPISNAAKRATTTAEAIAAIRRKQQLRAAASGNVITTAKVPTIAAADADCHELLRAELGLDEPEAAEALLSTPFRGANSSTSAARMKIPATSTAAASLLATTPLPAAGKVRAGEQCSTPTTPTASTSRRVQLAAISPGDMELQQVYAAVNERLDDIEAEVKVHIAATAGVGKTEEEVQKQSTPTRIRSPTAGKLSPATAAINASAAASAAMEVPSPPTTSLYALRRRSHVPIARVAAAPIALPAPVDSAVAAATDGAAGEGAASSGPIVVNKLQATGAAIAAAMAAASAAAAAMSAPSGCSHHATAPLFPAQKASQKQQERDECEEDDVGAEVIEQKQEVQRSASPRRNVMRFNNRTISPPPACSTNASPVGGGARRGTTPSRLPVATPTAAATAQSPSPFKAPAATPSPTSSSKTSSAPSSASARKMNEVALAYGVPSPSAAISPVAAARSFANTPAKASSTPLKMESSKTPTKAAATPAKTPSRKAAVATPGKKLAVGTPRAKVAIGGGKTPSKAAPAATPKKAPSATPTATPSKLQPPASGSKKAVAVAFGDFNARTKTLAGGKTPVKKCAGTPAKVVTRPTTTPSASTTATTPLKSITKGVTGTAASRLRALNSARKATSAAAGATPSTRATSAASTSTPTPTPSASASRAFADRVAAAKAKIAQTPKAEKIDAPSSSSSPLLSASQSTSSARRLSGAGANNAGRGSDAGLTSTIDDLLLNWIHDEAEDEGTPEPAWVPSCSTTDKENTYRGVLSSQNPNIISKPPLSASKSTSSPAPVKSFDGVLSSCNSILAQIDSLVSDNDAVIERNAVKIASAGVRRSIGGGSGSNSVRSSLGAPVPLGIASGRRSSAGSRGSMGSAGSGEADDATFDCMGWRSVGNSATNSARNSVDGGAEVL